MKRIARLAAILSVAALPVATQAADAPAIPGGAPGEAAPAPQGAPQAGAPQPTPEQAADIEAFKKFISSEEYGNMVVGVAMAGEKDVAPECKEPKPLGRADLTIFLPPTFKGGTTPVTGLWRDRVAIDRCGKQGFENVIVGGQEGSKPHIGLLVPGMTGATPPLQRQVMTKALPNLKAKCKDEKQILPIDSQPGKVIDKIEATPDGMALKGKWTEAWTFRACGKSVAQTVEYTADGKGAINVAVK